ncbi:MAG: hypothetical protein DRH15_03390 [Deltaproteobacteria bacterium]|nr:MAG: hypothetical protein DRH15_03390 [Deltaproteobacteria bacterium]
MRNSRVEVSTVWAVIVGGATAIAGRIHGGILLKTLITAKGQVFSAFSVDAKVLGLFVMIRQAQREDRILLRNFVLFQKL